VLRQIYKIKKWRCLQIAEFGILDPAARPLQSSQSSQAKKGNHRLISRKLTQWLCSCLSIAHLVRLTIDDSVASSAGHPLNVICPLILLPMISGSHQRGHHGKVVTRGILYIRLSTVRSFRGFYAPNPLYDSPLGETGPHIPSLVP
jgi:hypothetical protein